MRRRGWPSTHPDTTLTMVPCSKEEAGSDAKASVTVRVTGWSARRGPARPGGRTHSSTPTRSGARACMMSWGASSANAPCKHTRTHPAHVVSCRHAASTLTPRLAPAWPTCTYCLLCALSTCTTLMPASVHAGMSERYAVISAFTTRVRTATQASQRPAARFPSVEQRSSMPGWLTLGSRAIV